MFSRIVMWYMKSRAAKIGGGLTAGGGVLTLILALHTNITANIEKAEARSKEYANLKIESVQKDVQNLKNGQQEIKSMVRDIHRYLLKTKDK